MNKDRIITLLEILKKESDFNHKLKLKDIIVKLEENNINVNNRKTIYDDLKVLNNHDYIVEYDDGYYLLEAPFSLSEIKIIIDSLNSLKNLDDHFLNALKTKLFSFISKYEAKQIKNLEYLNKHTDKKFINRLEDVLEAINNNQTLIVKRKDKKEEIVPIFLHRQNDYYYLYYHYLTNNKIYHIRFDNILDTSITNNTSDITINKNTIINHINESTNSFYSGKTTTIKFEILDESNNLKARLQDDFSNIIFTKDGFSIKANINPLFFSKLCAYQNSIRISDKDIRKEYINFLKNIIQNN